MDRPGAGPAVLLSTPAPNPAWIPDFCPLPEEVAERTSQRYCSAAICREAPAMCDQGTTSSQAVHLARATRPADRDSEDRRAGSGCRKFLECHNAAPAVR